MFNRVVHIILLLLSMVSVDYNLYSIAFRGGYRGGTDVLQPPSPHPINPFSFGSFYIDQNAEEYNEIWS